MLRRSQRRAAAAAAALLALGACEGGVSLPRLGGDPPAAAPAWSPPAPVAAPATGAGGADALVAFAASAAPGQEGVVVENGIGQRARVVRAYQAASGRECREVVLGAGPAERARLVCRGDDGRFVEARPLLRGGAR